MCSPNTGSSPKLLSYQSRSPSKWWRGSAATTPWCKARHKMGTRLKETWSSGRCSFLLATIFESWTFGHFDNPVQVLSHALDRIMLGVFCLLLLAAAIFFAMMTNGTCVHDGKIITVTDVSRGHETNPFQQDI